MHAGQATFDVPALRFKKEAEISSSNPSSGRSKTEEYEVDCIVDTRKAAGRVEYLVRWKGFDDSQCTWEPESHFDTRECIDNFLRKRRRSAAT
jgi:hypothetical protein